MSNKNWVFSDGSIIVTDSSENSAITTATISKSKKVQPPRRTNRMEMFIHRPANNNARDIIPNTYLKYAFFVGKMPMFYMGYLYVQKIVEKILEAYPWVLGVSMDYCRHYGCNNVVHIFYQP
ncbi:MAG: hypothetical protein J6S80_02570 [Alphaproteobacteria bacterium]|nr:hypothetical protein [Alphaproteobacteria bacterium]